MAVFYLGELAAPLWGGLVDRYGGQRALAPGGVLVTAIALAALAPWLHCVDTDTSPPSIRCARCCQTSGPPSIAS